MRGDPEAEMHVLMQLAHDDFGVLRMVLRLATVACLQAQRSRRALISLLLLLLHRAQHVRITQERQWFCS